MQPPCHAFRDARAEQGISRQLKAGVKACRNGGGELRIVLDNAASESRLLANSISPYKLPFDIRNRESGFEITGM